MTDLKEYLQNIKPASIRWMQKNEPALYEELFQRTSFLKEDASMKERIYCVLFDITSPVLCVTCNENPVSYDNKGKTNAGYKKYCSSKCLAISDEVKSKKASTNIERYGTSNIFQSDEIKQKIRDTNIERYGVPSVLCNKEVREKGMEVMKERYGSEHYLQSDKGQQHHREVMKERYGVESAMHSNEIVEKVKNTNMERYGESWFYNTDEFKIKSKETMNTKYGVDYPTQSESIRAKILNKVTFKYNTTNVMKVPYIQQKVVKTNIERYGVESYQQKHISKESLERLNDPEWLIEQNYVKHKTLEAIGKELGVYDTTVGDYFRKHNIDVKMFAFSQAEKEILEFLSQHYNGTILENNRTIINPKELDIVIPDKKIAIEYCGLYWHSSDRLDKNYHYDKMKACNDVGYRLITIFEDEWLYKKDVMKSKLLSILGISNQQKIYARKTKVKETTIQEREELLDQYHVQGNGTGSITYGLYHEDDLVSVMTFKKRSEGVYELNRFASSCNVVGGFSKLLSHFKKNHEWNEIISFADRRWSEGNVYYKNGFELVDTLSPDYKYVVGDERIHKFNFRHKNLSKMEGYNSSLTELENTDNMGIYRIYDCGLLKFSIQQRT